MNEAATLPLLEAADLAGQRGERTLFQHLCLALPAGTVTWLRGRNGCGKTTLLRLLVGLTTPTAGEVRMFGREQRREDPSWRAGLVYIGHQNALKDDLTAAEALAFLMRLGGVKPEAERVRVALARLGVLRCIRAPVRTLSAGQRRRVALARLAMSMETPVWLLDEPFDSLDAEGVRAVNALLTEHAVKGGATLLTSHQSPGLSEPVPRIFELDGHEHL